MTDEARLDAANDAPETPSADLDALKAENENLRDQVLRYAAEADNTRRRAEREANDARAYAITKFSRDLLGVADNLSRALQHAPKDAAEPALKNLVVGVEMTEKELVAAFERNGLKRVEPARGSRFDPHLHQAMTEQPAEGVPPGGVVQVLQVGYELFGRIVRPALVVVAPRGEAAASAPPPTEGVQAAGAYAGGNGADRGASVDTKA